MWLRLDGVSRRIGERTLFADVKLEVRPGDRIGLVGPNGAGKSTLMRIASGEDPPDGGRVATGRGIRVARLRQEIDPTLSHSVREEASTALARLAELEQEIAALEARMAECGHRGEELDPALAERYDRARAAFEHGGGFQREARVERVLAGLGFAAEDRERPLSAFSGGWLMRVELAKLLLAEPDVLLLDEPTNHLDLPSIQWFEETLEGFPGAAVVISHDRAFLRRHVRRVAELDRGRFTLYETDYTRYLKERSERREQLLARKRAQDREIAQVERFVERFRYKASKARQVQSRVKALEKLERVDVEPENRRRMRLRIPSPERAGETVLALEDVHKAYGATRVYAGAELAIRRGDRVALVGPNGAGKSTLLRIAAGALGFDAGERRLGHNVQVAFYAQHQLESLDPRRTVLEELAAHARTEDVPRLRGHLGAFLFSGDDVEKPVSVLSGGEKARLALARMLLRPANFLVLDEPTNHLDVEACEVLEQALREYDGTVLVISHDRDFLNALATRVIEIRAGTLREFPGNYDAYLAASEAPGAGAGAVPGHGVPGAASGPAPAAAAETAPAPPPSLADKEARKEARARSRERRKERERKGRTLGRLEAEIGEREQAMESLGWRLADPEVHRDGERARALEAERGALRGEIERLYGDWERLAAEVEALDEALSAEG